MSYRELSSKRDAVPWAMDDTHLEKTHPADVARLESTKPAKLSERAPGIAKPLQFEPMPMAAPEEWEELGETREVLEQRLERADALSEKLKSEYDAANRLMMASFTDVGPNLDVAARLVSQKAVDNIGEAMDILRSAMQGARSSSMKIGVALREQRKQGMDQDVMRDLKNSGIGWAKTIDSATAKAKELFQMGTSRLRVYEGFIERAYDKTVEQKGPDIFLKAQGGENLGLRAGALERYAKRHPEWKPKLSDKDRRIHQGPVTPLEEPYVEIKTAYEQAAEPIHAKMDVLNDALFSLRESRTTLTSASINFGKQSLVQDANALDGLTDMLSQDLENFSRVEKSWENGIMPISASRKIDDDVRELQKQLDTIEERRKTVDEMAHDLEEKIQQTFLEEVARVGEEAYRNATKNFKSSSLVALRVKALEAYKKQSGWQKAGQRLKSFFRMG